MRPCPYCSEQIQDAATKCRYCQMWLVPPPPAYAPGPPYAGYPQQTRRTSGIAIASLVLGVLWIYWLGSILALVFGYLARKEIRNSREQLDGNGLATAGIVLGWVGISTLVLVIGIVIIAALVDTQQHKTTPNNTSHHANLISPPREFVRERPLLHCSPPAHRLPS